MAIRKQHEDYDLSKIEDRLKYIKAINNRIRNYAKVYGKDSIIYKKQVNELHRMFYDDSIIRENKNGIAQLSESKQYLNKYSTFEILNRKRYLNRETANENIKTTFEKMKERGELDSDLKLNQQFAGPPTKDGQYPTVKAQVINYSIKYAEVSDEISEDVGFLYGVDSESAKSAIDILKITGRKNTYGELEIVKEEVRKAKRMSDWSPNDF